MKSNRRKFYLSFVAAAVLLGTQTTSLQAKHKDESDQNGPTARLFQFVDSTRGGKLEDFYLLADLYKEPGKSDQELRHVLKVDYDKNRGFGKLRVYVRSVGRMTPDQLATYSPKQIYDFGEVDLEKFVKTSPGAFGGMGDVYLRSSGDGPLATTNITDEARKEYDTFITDYILPALEKAK